MKSSVASSGKKAINMTSGIKMPISDKVPLWIRQQDNFIGGEAEFQTYVHVYGEVC